MSEAEWGAYVESPAVDELLTRIDRLLGIASRFLATPGDAAGPALYAANVLAAAGELLAGASSEVRAKRLANAARLCGDLLEHQLELDYVLADFAPRAQQVVAAMARDAIERGDAELPGGQPRDALVRFLDLAQAREARARATRQAGLSDRGFLPGHEEMARDLRLTGWSQAHRAMSRVAHAGRAGSGPSPGAEDPAGDAGSMPERQERLALLILCESARAFGRCLGRAGATRRVGFPELLRILEVIDSVCAGAGRHGA